MKWLMLVVVALAVPALAGCQVTPEFVRAALCAPVVVPPPDVEPVPEVSEPSSW